MENPSNHFDKKQLSKDWFETARFLYTFQPTSGFYTLNTGWFNQVEAVLNYRAMPMGYEYLNRLMNDSVKFLSDDEDDDMANPVNVNVTINMGDLALKGQGLCGNQGGQNGSVNVGGGKATITIPAVPLTPANPINVTPPNSTNPSLPSPTPPSTGNPSPSVPSPVWTPMINKDECEHSVERIMISAYPTNQTVGTRSLFMDGEDNIGVIELPLSNDTSEQKKVSLTFEPLDGDIFTLELMDSSMDLLVYARNVRSSVNALSNYPYDVNADELALEQVLAFISESDNVSRLSSKYINKGETKTLSIHRDGTKLILTYGDRTVEQSFLGFDKVAISMVQPESMNGHYVKPSPFNFVRTGCKKKV